MTNLVIHPVDSSTDFLEGVYEHLEDYVWSNAINYMDTAQLIRNAHKVFMMGHGCPSGLFNTVLNEDLLLVKDTNVLDLRRNIDGHVYIWCNADKFVERYKLKGFYTGMFISEVGEARIMLPYRTDIDQEVVDESNYKFVESISQVINESSYEIYKHVKETYGEIVDTNPVAKYNHDRLYWR